MHRHLFVNKSYGIIDTDLTAGALSVVLGAGDGARFPVIADSDHQYLTIIDKDNASRTEIVKYTGKAGDTLTIERAQNGTTAKAFVTGDLVEMRLVSAAMDLFPQTPVKTPAFTWDVAAQLTPIPDGTTITKEFAIPKATMLHIVMASIDRNLQGMILSGYVKVNGTVTLTIFNGTGSNKSVAAGAAALRIWCLE
jgi:hypothetical protein